MKKIISLGLITALAIIVLLGSRSDMITSLYDAAGDNINYGWEVKRNSEHRQPDISRSASEMLSKYNGIYAGNNKLKAIYLTIDLGYENGNTALILDTLKKNDVKATFFVVASYIQKNEMLTDRIVNEGHSIQNHTANYKHLDKLGDYQVKREIMDLHNIVFKKYGISMKYLRLPYEEWSDRVMEIACSTGYKTVFWSVACVDWVEDKDASYIYDSVVKNIHNGAVILLHSVSKSSPQALDMIIRKLKDQGYEFRVLDI